MTETAFIEKNKETWEKLEAYSKTLSKRGIKRFTRREVDDFANVYRATGYHLSYAKTKFPDGTSVPYLQHIVGVAHNYYYTDKKSGLRSASLYFSKEFPLAVRQTFSYSLTAFGVFMLCALFAVFLQFIRTDVQNPGIDLERLTYQHGEIVADYSVVSAYIITNNVRVSFMAFAFGITFGAGTFYVLAVNGLMLGELAGYIMSNGSREAIIVFWSLILPHGVIELLAIFLSGGCGLIIGRAALIPGKYNRKTSITLAARKAAVILPGIVTLLIIAGIIEGFFTTSAASPIIKLGFSFVTGVGLWLYFSKK